jgi:hypothetical protein
LDKLIGLGIDTASSQFVVAEKTYRPQFIGTGIYSPDGASAARRAKEALGAA